MRTTIQCILGCSVALMLLALLPLSAVGHEQTSDCCGGLGQFDADGSVAFSFSDGVLEWDVACEYVLTTPSIQSSTTTVALSAEAQVRAARVTATPAATRVHCYLDDAADGAAADVTMPGSRVEAVGLQTYDVRNPQQVCVTAAAETLSGQHGTDLVCEPIA